MFDAVLLLKLGLAPVLILAASLAGNRWGNTVSGWIVGLPLTSAPVIFILALEQGGDFAAASAQGSMLGLASLSAFSLVFSLLILRMRFDWKPAIAVGWVVFFLASFLLEGVNVPLVVSFVGVSVWLVFVARLFPKTDATLESGKSDWRDIAIRMVAAVSLIFAVTEFAPTLGPRLSGLLTLFPVYTSVLAASIYRREGAASRSRWARAGGSTSRG